MYDIENATPRSYVIRAYRRRFSYKYTSIYRVYRPGRRTTREERGGGCPVTKRSDTSVNFTGDHQPRLYGKRNRPAAVYRNILSNLRGEVRYDFIMEAGPLVTVARQPAPTLSDDVSL